jgi:hypothetical protein
MSILAVASSSSAWRDRVRAMVRLSHADASPVGKRAIRLYGFGKIEQDNSRMGC